MTVFNAFISVVKRNWVTIVIFTLITVVFSLINFQSSEAGSAFSAEKPDIICINNDSSALADNFVKYLSECAVLNESGGEAKDNDALFYREVCCIITIPSGYGDRVISGEDGGAFVSTTGDSKYSLIEMNITRYLRAQSYYCEKGLTEKALTDAVNESVKDTVQVTMTAAENYKPLVRTASYFSFAAYSIMACILFIICLVLTSFNNIHVLRRTIVSAMDFRKYSLNLMLCCGVYALAVWLAFVLLGAVLCGGVMLTVYGALFAVNSLLFDLCILSLAFLLSGILHSRNAVTGIVNVIALGSSFLCGAFIPAQYLPDGVLMAAQILPAYWFIDANSRIAELGGFSLGELTPVLINFCVIIIFGIIFTAAGVIISSAGRRRE